MKITVTPWDIIRGERRGANTCPISLALRRQTQAPYSLVSADHISIGKGPNGPRKYLTSGPQVAQFVKLFDREGKLATLRTYGLKGFSFTLQEA